MNDVLPYKVENFDFVAELGDVEILQSGAVALVLNTQPPTRMVIIRTSKNCHHVRVDGEFFGRSFRSLAAFAKFLDANYRPKRQITFDIRQLTKTRISGGSSPAGK